MLDQESLKVHTWAGLDAHCPEGVLGIRVRDHLVGFRVVDHLRRTFVLTGSIIIKVPTGLDRKYTNTSRIICKYMLSFERHVPSSVEELHDVVVILAISRENTC